MKNVSTLSDYQNIFNQPIKNTQNDKLSDSQINDNPNEKELD